MMAQISWEQAAGLYNHWIAIFLMMVGLYVVISRNNLIKKLVGITIFQTSVFILFITMGKIEGGTAPIYIEGATAYSNPLPHVLILTAIVVSVAITAVGLGLVIRIQEAFGTIEADELMEEEREW